MHRRSWGTCPENVARGEGGEPEHLSSAGTADTIVFVSFVFPLTWISPSTVLVSEQMVAFLLRLSVDSLLKELLWRQPQMTVARPFVFSSALWLQTPGPFSSTG